MLTGRPSRSSNLSIRPRRRTGAPTAAVFTLAHRQRPSSPCALADVAPDELDPGRVVVVPGRDPGLEIAGLTVARGVVCDPVERSVEERELIGEPCVRVVADRGVPQSPGL